MGMTQAILEARRKHLGASETPTVLGYGKYAGQTPDSVYWSKVGPSVERGSDAKALGNDFEPALASFAQRKLGVTFVTDPSDCFQVMLEGIGKGVLSATPDGILVNGRQRWGLEGKAVMPGNPGVDQWGEDEGSDKVPDDVLIQVQQQMAVWNLEVTFVPVLWCIGYRPEFRLYKVNRDPEFWDMCLAPRAVEWWNRHVVAQVPPGNEPMPMDVIKRLERKQGLFVPASEVVASWIETWDAVRQEKNSREKDADALLRDILGALGDAEGFQMPNGRTFRYAEQNGQRRCDLDGLKRFFETMDTFTFANDSGALMCDMSALLSNFEGMRNAMDIYNQYVTQGKCRVARITGKAKVTA